VVNLLRRLAGRKFPKPAPAPSAHRTVPTGQRGRRIAYAPNLDGDADPGEVVWTWVRYEEDSGQGKDRPVLVVGRDGRTLLGLMLSSQSDRDGQRDWLALAPAPGTPSAGPAGSAWTGCWRWTRTASAARARSWTGHGSTGLRTRSASGTGGPDRTAVAGEADNVEA
jgi:hypothetical protein